MKLDNSMCNYNYFFIFIHYIIMLMGRLRRWAECEITSPAHIRRGECHVGLEYNRYYVAVAVAVAGKWSNHLLFHTFWICKCIDTWLEYSQVSLGKWDDMLKSIQISNGAFSFPKKKEEIKVAFNTLSLANTSTNPTLGFSYINFL